MLRSFVKSNHLLMASRRTLSSVAGEPSTTTTVVLKNISPTTTETSLKAGLSEINFRKVEIEPGCSIHVRNEAEAMHISSSIASKFNYEGAISSTTMPSLLLQNLPSSICSDNLKRIFGKYDPKTVRLIGTKSIQVNEVDLLLLLQSVIESCHFVSSRRRYLLEA